MSSQNELFCRLVLGTRFEEALKKFWGLKGTLFVDILTTQIFGNECSAYSQVPIKRVGWIFYVNFLNKQGEGGKAVNLKRVGLKKVERVEKVQVGW